MAQRRIVRQRCQSPYSVSQATVIGMLPEGSRQREFLESLDKDHWETTSFDPDTGNVCIRILNDRFLNPEFQYSGVNITVTLPKLIF